MPRESVRSADYRFVPISADSGQDGPIEWPAECRLGQVEVGWTKVPTGRVDVATTDESMLYGPEGLLAQVGRALSEGHDVEVVIRDFFRTGGFWVNLDRDGCNTLIEKIRKARNDAFGKDA